VKHVSCDLMKKVWSFVDMKLAYLLFLTALPGFIAMFVVQCSVEHSA